MKLLKSLQNPNIYSHSVTNLEIIETHISWVVLTGDFAYKIKKPVDLGFLDYSSLKKRHFYCGEEIRLNKRLAPQLYVQTVAITGTPEQIEFNGIGPVLEYAVQMRQFPQNQQFDRLLAQNQLTYDDLQTLAQIVAKFHQHADTCERHLPFGDPQHVFLPIEENFLQIANLIEQDDDKTTLQEIKYWCENEHTRLQKYIVERKRQGYIRECHGDMHLRNIAKYRNDIVIFDCIEFNDNLRWIDVISEIAFVEMDLIDRGRPDFANLLLNEYLQTTGDYLGLRLLRFYMVYRAMVRAKVDCIRAHQTDLEPRQQKAVMEEFRHYLRLGKTFTKTEQPFLAITHGFSGSGKTSVTNEILKHLPVIRIRSDIERKRLFGLGTLDRSDAEIDQGIYSKEATNKTYHHLIQLAEQLLNANWNVVIDAAFLQQKQRELFQSLAQRLKIPFVILSMQASEERLRERVTLRWQQQQDASEADLAVLEKQLSSAHELSEQERQHTIPINTDVAIDHQALAASIRAKLQPHI
ncbi:bifunctional aminoglycoside phosphotransferase/ATP-binding protein [Kaarinaea lacus]